MNEYLVGALQWVYNLFFNIYYMYVIQSIFGFKQKVNIVTFMKSGLIAGLLDYISFNWHTK